MSHVDETGRLQMVDVGGKEITRRRAVAEGRIATSAEAVAQVVERRAAKGDVLAAARVAGIAAAKRTAELIPLCHTVAIDSVKVEITAPGAAAQGAAAGPLEKELGGGGWAGPGFLVRAEAVATGRTGVEMEALTAVSGALLTLYDMLKAVDRAMEIGALRLLLKEGGRSGRWRRDG